MESESLLPHSQESATCPILCLINPLHTTLSHVLKIHFNIIFHLWEGLPTWYLYLRAHKIRL